MTEIFRKFRKSGTWNAGGLGSNNNKSSTESTAGKGLIEKADAVTEEEMSEEDWIKQLAYAGYFALLPPEIVLHILNFLPLNTWGKGAQVFIDILHSCLCVFDFIIGLQKLESYLQTIVAKGLFYYVQSQWKNFENDTFFISTTTRV